MSKYTANNAYKVKAHRRESEVCEGDKADFWGNYWADLYAKRAVEVVQPPDHVIREHTEAFEGLVDRFRGLAKVLAEWPYAAELYIFRRASRNSDQRPVMRNFCTVPHELTRLPGGAVCCLACGAKPRTDKGVQKLLKTSCRALTGRQTRELADSANNRHIVRAVTFQRVDTTLFVCSKCGCYGMHRFQGLRAACRGRRHAKEHVLKRIQQGRHPTKPWMISSVHRVSSKTVRGQSDKECAGPDSTERGGQAADAPRHNPLDDPEWDPMDDLSD